MSTASSTSSTKPACQERHYSVRRSDLPLSCPSPEMAVWNAHPRVYLPIEKSGRARCPYCGAQYELIDD